MWREILQNAGGAAAEVCMQESRAVIRLGSIRANAQYFLSRAQGAKLCAVVKANAYGHGAVAVAQALSGVADMFAVALVEEGAQLRHAGVREDILVLCPPLGEDDVVRGARHRLIFTVSDAEDYRLLGRVCEQYGICVSCHIKVNTGMNRFGFDADAFDKFLAGRLSGRVRAEGIYSHFYRPEDAETAEKQFALFQRFCAPAERAFGSLLRHIAATGGVLASPVYCLDMVRVGIGLYGYLPEGFFLPAGTLRPALSVSAQVACAREYRGGGAGYGEYIPQGKDLCVVRAGYADGFFRANAGKNSLCMDACVEESKRNKYDEVCIFSDADAYARRHGTISYEALVNVGRRAVREYVSGEDE